MNSVYLFLDSSASAQPDSAASGAGVAPWSPGKTDWRRMRLSFAAGSGPIWTDVRASPLPLDPPPVNPSTTPTGKTCPARIARPSRGQSPRTAQ